MPANVGEFIATTLKDYSAEIADNVSNHNALLRRIKDRGGISQVVNGGRKIAETLDYAENSTYQRYSGYDTFDVGASEVIDEAEFEAVQAKVSVTWSGREKAMNMGKAQIKDKIKAKIKNGERTMMNNISVDVYSDGSLNNQIGGVQLLVADDPTTSTDVGGINQGTYSFWRNQVYDFTDNSQTAAANMLEGMRQLWLQCTRGSDKPDLILADHNYYVIYENTLQEQARYASMNQADGGFISLKFKDADVIFDSSDSGIPENHMYFLNTDYMKFRYYPGRNFEPTDPIKSFNQDAEVVHMLWMGNLTTSNRSLQGVLKS